ncbi:MAG TPA: TRAP transporter substrate-binding protein DctP, partial [Usitatibacter sp.]|nr:TRAP transporter substrate-binding protein DctP [Usitatibacter sp.]
SQERAKRINQSGFMKEIRAEIERKGGIVLADAWFAGGVAAKGGCPVKPDDLKGKKIRAAGPTFAAMWEAAGASIVSPPSNEIYNAFQSGVVNSTDTSLSTFANMWEAAGASIVSPPSNEIYNAFQSGVVNATDTSLGTFYSQRLYEVTDCLTAPGNNALWFMYEPVLMSKKSFDRLDKKQQEALIAAGKKAQAYYEGKAEAVNEEAIKAFRDHKKQVVTLSDADFNAWLDVARKSSYARFAKDVPNGQKLIDEALAVK